MSVLFLIAARCSFFRRLFFSNTAISLPHYIYYFFEVARKLPWATLLIPSVFAYFSLCNTLTSPRGRHINSFSASFVRVLALQKGHIARLFFFHVICCTSYYSRSAGKRTERETWPLHYPHFTPVVVRFMLACYASFFGGRAVCEPYA